MIRPRTILLAALVEVALTAGLARLVGTPLAWSALIALPVAAVLVLLLSTHPGVEPSWSPPPEPLSVAAHLEASTLASRLEDAAVDHGRFVGRIQPRLARLALGRLRTRPGLADLADLSDPRARAALGGELHRLVTDASADLPTPDALLALLKQLEET